MQQGSAQQQAANFAAGQDMTQADQTQAMGYQQAKRIREQGRATQGQATAALAASGVDVGTGTSNDIRQKIDQNTETDALNTILNAGQKAGSLRQQAQMEVQSGQNAASAGGLNALTSVLKGAGMLTKGGWKSAATSY
ncbi:hypothetical protein GIY62_06400 [Burkholderia plantarii]|uniref:hypothetical protein n=1 Tax=Burkholderia plantarii TaxID=41899 RepID=UPI002729B3A0|nr:hypothetical protein [Burkholderia plantarii]WLE60285.1 hypothetical protein GIY62_06400 [Burkholderia plantarii]